jgi:excisionase family DNA binding protein
LEYLLRKLLLPARSLIILVHLEEFGAMAAARAFRIREVCKTTGLCRTTIYAAIKSGDLTARKYGRCTVILAVDLEKFLNDLPTTGAPCAKEQVDSCSQAAAVRLINRGE